MKPTIDEDRLAKITKLSAGRQAPDQRGRLRKTGARAMTTTLQAFLRGDPLEYAGYKKKCTATYRAGVGVIVESRRGEDIGVSEVAKTDRAAARLYHNLTREPIDEQVRARVVGRGKTRGG